MLDLNDIRRQFAEYLHADPTRWRMDAALAHVVTSAYTKGLIDGAGTRHGVETTAAVLVAARQQIAIDRQAAYDCAVSPVTHSITDPADAAFVAQYDTVLVQIDDALKAITKEAA